MKLEKGRGRAYPNDALVVPEETLEDRMRLLLEMKNEYKVYRQAFKKKHENLVASIKSLENIISAEVIEKKETVIIDGMKAEYIPNVVFRLKKEKEDE